MLLNLGTEMANLLIFYTLYLKQLDKVDTPVSYPKLMR